MKKVLCNMNHYYDADKFSTCPHCARAKAFLERSAPAAQRSEPPAQGAPARLRLRPHPYRSSRRAVRAAVRNCANGSRFARSAACG